MIIDDAEEVYTKSDGDAVRVGRILLKGDNITLIQAVQ